MSPASLAYNLWGLQVVPSTLLGTTQFLIGSSAPQAAQIFDRHSLVVEMSTEHNENFKKNLVTFRAEERIAFVVKRPDSFVTGSFTQSPA
jgi:HK97 family phage major capsid protein